jgi:hypothetical protein
MSATGESRLEMPLAKGRRSIRKTATTTPEKSNAAQTYPHRDVKRDGTLHIHARRGASPLFAFLRRRLGSWASRDGGGPFDRTEKQIDRIR